MMKVYIISMSAERRDANAALIRDWFGMMDVRRAISEPDGYLASNECDVFFDSEMQTVDYFFTDAHLACLFKMRFE